MIVIDSSGWIEVFTGGVLAARYREYPDAEKPVLVPIVVLYEVYRVLRRERSESDALLAVAHLRSHRVVPLDERLALEAADFSLQHQLPMADAMVYATAQAHHALLVTSDEHFAALPGVDYLARSAP